MGSESEDLELSQGLGALEVRGTLESVSAWPPPSLGSCSIGRGLSRLGEGCPLQLRVPVLSLSFNSPPQVGIH